MSDSPACRTVMRSCSSGKAVCTPRCHGWQRWSWALPGLCRMAWRARLSNAPLRIDLNAVMPQFGLRRARVVNDFVCEACACLTRVGERSLHLLGPADIPCPSHRSPGEAPAPVAVLGAGTGLGSGWLVPQADGGGCAGRPCRQSPGIRPLPFWGGKKRTSRSLPVNGWDGHCCVLMMWSRGAVWPCCTTF